MRRGHALAVAVFAFFLIRLAAGMLTIRRGEFLRYDGAEYHDLARNLAAGKGYLVEHVRWFERPRPTPAPDFSRPPLFPLVLAAFYAVLPDSVYVAAAVQAALGALTCLLCGAVARALWGERAGWAALVLAGVYPPFIYYSSYAMTETLSSLLTAALILALVGVAREADGPKGRAAARAGAAGVLLGLSALCRPAMLVGFALVTVWAVAALRCDRLRRLMLAGTLLGTAVLTVTPWTARNCLSARAFFPVTNLGGYVFWLGNNDDNFRAYASLSYRDFLRHQDRALHVEGPRLQM